MFQSGGLVMGIQLEMESRPFFRLGHLGKQRREVGDKELLVQRQ
jgi:hypothetical protein